MPRSTVADGADSGISARQRLLVATERLPKPNAPAFQKTTPPPASELEGYRIVEDPKLRTEIIASGLGELVQRPGPGNWKKNARPPFILKIHPNFDAPASASPARVPRVSQRQEAAEPGLSSAVVHDLRSKWEQYYADTRPERQREHERRSTSADPITISERAKELIAEAKRNGRRSTTREAMLQATDEITSDFESVMRRRHGDLVVDVLGIPDA
jgi:hypothetical protein